jgi:hypothetical protein
MADLKIWFDQMFLLVKDDANPVVLFPTGEVQGMAHRLFIIGVEPNTAIQVRGADLTFWETDSGGNRTRFWGQRESLDWPDRRRLLDFNTLAPPPASERLIKKDMYSKDGAASCPIELHARLYTPFGDFDAQFNSREHGDARWLVGPPGRKKDQWLTDLMTFECDLDDNATYELGVEVEGVVSYIPLQTRAGKDIELVFFNDDMPPDNLVPSAASFITLSDFEVIYALARGGADFDAPEYYDAGTPIPRTARRQQVITKTRCVGANCINVTSDSFFYPLSSTNPAFPICGGGTGDPEP